MSCWSPIFLGRREQRYLSIGIALLGAIVAGILAARQFGHDHDAFFGGFMTGGFATVFQEIILIAAAGSLILYGAIGPRNAIAGTTAIMLWSACGAMLMAGAANLMMIFLGLELLSLGLYALCGAVDRKTARESALKYLILSSTATGFLLFGIGAALRRDRQRHARRFRQSRARARIRSSGWAPACS